MKRTSILAICLAMVAAASCGGNTNSKKAVGGGETKAVTDVTNLYTIRFV